MNTPTPKNKRNRQSRGMTLLELTVVILVLLSLISIIFIGVNGWKNGSNRSGCIMNIRNVQMAVRGYSNVNSHHPGETLTGVVLKDEIIGTDKALAEDPDCPGSGDYSFGGDVIPDIGSLYMTCSLASSDEHVPPEIDGW